MPSVDVQYQKKEYVSIYIFVIFNSLIVNLLFNSQIFMIEPIKHRVLVYLNGFSATVTNTKYRAHDKSYSSTNQSTDARKNLGWQVIKK